MDDDEMMKLFNIVGRESINIEKDFKEITNPESSLLAMGLDSLDFITLFIYIGDIFDMPDEDFNKHPLMATGGPTPTFANLIDVIRDIGKNLEISFEEAKEII